MADPNASVFNVSDFTVTRRVAQNYMDDVKVPIKDGVAKGAIDSPSFLTGITAGVAGNINDGVEQAIINGDQVEEVKGKQAAKVTADRDTHVVGSLKTLVDVKEERTVKDARTTTIKKDDNLTIGLNHNVDVMRDVHKSILGSVIETVIGSKKFNEVSTYWNWQGVKAIEGAFDFVKVCGVKADISVLAYAFTFWNSRNTVFGEKKAVVETESVLVVPKMEIIKPTLSQISAITGGPHFHGMAPPFHVGA